MEKYNSNLDKIPNFVKSVLGNERINAELLSAEGNRQYGIVMNEGAIASIGTGFLENPTLEIKASKSTIKSILQADNQLNQLEYALDNDEITYDAIGLKTEAKTFLADLAVDVLGQKSESTQQESEPKLENPAVIERLPAWIWLLLPFALLVLVIGSVVSLRSLHKKKHISPQNQQLKSYIYSTLKTGYPKEHLYYYLLQKGWPKNVLDQTFQDIYNEQMKR
jgi:hypothetical protein